MIQKLYQKITQNLIQPPPLIHTFVSFCAREAREIDGFLIHPCCNDGSSAQSINGVAIVIVMILYEEMTIHTN